MPFSLALKRSGIDGLGAALLAAVLVLFVAGCSPAAGDWRGRLLPDRAALRSALEAPDEAMLRQVYATRGFQPIWMGGETRMSGARQLVWLLETSDSDGLTPVRYRPQVLARRLDTAWRSSFRERARTELLLTAAYIEYVHDLHTPAAQNDLAYTDRDLQPPLRDRAAIARQLAGNAWPQVAIKDATQMNVLYMQMRDAVAHLRSVGPNPDEPRLMRNLDRLRALPSNPGDRFVLVDVAANRLWLYQDNKPVDSMKVVVGAPNGQTPQMAGLIRYAMYNPYWNVPPDLTRDNYAPRIAANLSALADLRMDAWSSFTAGAQVLSPRAVNWTAVARGQDVAWLRQRPGPANSMGAVKFMLPNELGIYLHDTPHRELFDEEARFFSAGCIRVEDYHRLSRWLFSGAEITAQGAAAEQRFDLPAPVPVYIVYLTARVENGAVQVQPDVYGRDRVQPPAETPPPITQRAAPQPAASPAPPAATFERSPEAAAPVRPRPAPAPQSAPVPTAPVPTAAVPKVQPAQPAVSPVPPRAAPASPRPAPLLRAPVPVPVPKVQPSQPAAVAQRPAPASPSPRPAPPPPPRAPVPAPVPKVQPAPPAAIAQRPAPAPARAAGACRIQAGVFSQRANADNLAKAMQPLGEVRLTEVQRNGNVLYSVALVGLPSRREAESALSKLTGSGVKLSAPRITGCPAAAG